MNQPFFSTRPGRRNAPASRAVSRRSFLRCGVVLAGVAPLLASARVFGANSKIVMGCIGVGGQGTRGMAGGIWAPEGGFIAQSRVRVVAVCDVKRDRRENARRIVNERYANRDCRTYRDFRELLARPDIDAVLIATGDRWHPLVSMAAARAGKDMYCEKPISVTIEELLAMRATMEQTGAIFQMGTQQRSSQAFRFACELVRNGYLGELKEVVVAVGGPPSMRECPYPPAPVPEGLDYDRWLGPIPWRPYCPQFVGGWMAYRDCSGGEMTNWGAHHFDIAQWGIGSELSGPVEIIPPDGRDVKVLTYRYPNGVLLTRDPDRMQRECGQGNGVMFFGSEGKLAVWRYDLRTWPEHLSRQRLKPDELHLHEAYNHHTDFLDSVQNRSLPGSNIRVAVRSLTVCHLGNIAYELGRPVRWNPDTERFVNDPEADRLFGRPMRAPWHL